MRQRANDDPNPQSKSVKMRRNKPYLLQVNVASALARGRESQMDKSWLVDGTVYLADVKAKFREFFEGESGCLGNGSRANSSEIRVIWRGRNASALDKSWRPLSSRYW